MKRREFLQKSALFGAAAMLAPELFVSCAEKPAKVYQPRSGGKMKLSFFPYELKLRHTFTVSTYSRTTTPDVQVRIEYEGFVGHGEASLPPYLGYTQQGTMDFLAKVDLSQFSSPFLMEDILEYVDGIEEGQTPAKAAIDIALHDLAGQL